MQGRGLIKNVFDPNPNNGHNYLLDTSAFNRIVDNIADIEILKESILRGFSYYKTLVQDNELIGAVPTHSGLVIKESDDLIYKKPIFNKIITDLDVKRVSNIATLHSNIWVLDGTVRILKDDGVITEMFDDIAANKNIKHYDDAVIAESAITNNCILVSADRRLKNKVNKYFQGRAITYEMLIEEIKKVCSERP